MKLEETTLYEWRKSTGSSFTHHAGACMNLIDALSSLHGAESIVELSLSPLHERGYASINNAISSCYKPRNMSHEDAIHRKSQVDKNIENTLCQYPDKDDKYHAFAGDATPRKRPHAKKLLKMASNFIESKCYVEAFRSKFLIPNTSIDELAIEAKGV